MAWRGQNAHFPDEPKNRAAGPPLQAPHTLANRRLLVLVPAASFILTCYPDAGCALWCPIAPTPRAMPGGGRTCRYVCVGCEVDGRRAKKRAHFHRNAHESWFLTGHQAVLRFRSYTPPFGVSCPPHGQGYSQGLGRLVTRRLEAQVISRGEIADMGMLTALAGERAGRYTAAGGCRIARSPVPP